MQNTKTFFSLQLQFHKIMKFPSLLSKVFCLFFSLSHLIANDSIPPSPPSPDLNNFVFQSQLKDFSKLSYRKIISSFFLSYEQISLKKITPQNKQKVGLKIYSNSGVGHATPKNLLDAVIDELVSRGWKKENIFIVDLDRRKLRDAAFLPSLSDLQNKIPDSYNGSPVIDLNSENYYHKNWFYDNPLMPRVSKYSPEFTGFASGEDRELRKSYLPVPLFLMVDFWINLPVITDLEGLGISAALANMTIWNMSNSERFLKTPSNTPIAVAEVAAIPELHDSNIFSIISFEQVQYVGGTVFNSACCSSENLILMSKNPNVLDYIAFEFINRARTSNGFKPISPQPPIFDYAKQMQLGDWNPSNVKFIQPK